MNDYHFYQDARALNAQCTWLLHGDWQTHSQEAYDAELCSIAQKVFALIHQDQEYLHRKQLPYVGLICRLKVMESLKANITRLLFVSPAHGYFYSYFPLLASQEGLAQKMKAVQSHLNLHHRFPLQLPPLRQLFETGLRKKMSAPHFSDPKQIAKDAYHLMASSLKSHVMPLELKLKFDGNFECAGLISFAALLKEAQRSLPLFQNNKKISFLIGRLQAAYPFSIEQFLISEKILNFSTPSILLPREASLLQFQRENLRLMQEAPVDDLIQDSANKMSQSLQELKKNDVRLFLFGTAGHRFLLEIKCLAKDIRFKNSRFALNLFNRGFGIHYHQNQTQEGEMTAFSLNFRWVKGSVLDPSFFATMLRFAILETNIELVYSFLDSKLTEEGRGSCQDGDEEMFCPLYGVCAYNCIEGWIQSRLTPQEQEGLERFKFQKAVKKLERLIARRSKDQASLKRVSIQPLQDLESAAWQALLDIGRAHLKKWEEG